MAAVAEELSSYSIVTSDNPRSEDPEMICKEIVAGFKNKNSYEVILDRYLAIKRAIEISQPNDIILIAGKGHENYQEIDGVRHWFDDVVEVQSAIAAQSHSVDSAYPAQ